MCGDTPIIVRNGDHIGTFPDKKREIGFEPDPKEDHSGWVKCEACGTYNHWLNSGQVETGPKVGDKTLWFCNKKCYIAYIL